MVMIKSIVVIVVVAAATNTTLLVLGWPAALPDLHVHVKRQNASKRTTIYRYPK